MKTPTTKQPLRGGRRTRKRGEKSAKSKNSGKKRGDGLQIPSKEASGPLGGAKGGPSSKSERDETTPNQGKGGEKKKKKTQGREKPLALREKCG